MLIKNICLNVCSFCENKYYDNLIPLRYETVYKSAGVANFLIVILNSHNALVISPV